MNNDNSYFVAAKPVWDLVRKRQRHWGYTDDEMAACARLVAARARPVRGQLVDGRVDLRSLAG